MNNIDDDSIIGIIIVKPHGSFIASGDKTVIIKSKPFSKMSHRPLLLLQQKEALGLLEVSDMQTINLSEFNSLKPDHMITDAERKKWWPGKRTFYAFKIIKRRMFAAPVPIAYNPGPQVFIHLTNIKPLQKLYIGTSGYSYSWWKNFYHGRTNSQDQFQIYTDQFSSLEINGSFYKNYSKDVWNRLRESAPSDFAFTVKVNQAITHYYQYGLFKKFWSNVSVLKPKCLLFQFPEHFKYSEANMKRLKNLPAVCRSAFEFRSDSWYRPDVYALFRSKRKWSIVISYHGFKWSGKSTSIGFVPELSVWPKTSDFIYMRFHGSDRKYSGSHGTKILTQCAKFIRDLYTTKSIKYVFAFFNNTDSLDNNGISSAINDAVKLQNLLGF